jgi:hypothetical protein
MHNTLKRFYIHRETVIDNQLNDKNTVASKAIFDYILCHNKDNTSHF